MFVETLHVDAFAAAPDDLQRGLEWWRNGCARGDPFSLILPSMQILHPSAEKGFFYSHVGRESTASQVFGREWAMNALGEPQTPSGSVEQSANGAYATVITDPYYGRVTGVIDGLQVPLFVTYQRLIVPFELTPGHRSFAIFTDFTETPQPVC